MRLNIRLLSALFIAAAFPIHPAFPQSASFTQLVTQAVPTETLSVMPITTGNERSVQFRAKVAGAPAGIPTGSITYKLTPSDTSEAPATMVLPLQNGEALLEIPAPTTNYTISATYSGDTNYRATSAASTGSGRSLPADFDFTTSTIALKQGQTWSGGIRVVPINGFAKTVTFVCSAPAVLSCNLATKAYTFTQSGATASSNILSLTIVTYAGEFVAGSFLLLPLLSFRQGRRTRIWLSIATCFVLQALFGCGTSSRLGWQPITPKGKYQVLITGTAAGIEHSKELTVVVE